MNHSPERNHSPESARRLAMHRLQERARRIGRIRRTVVAGAVATFALAWGLSLNDQLASGTKTRPAQSKSPNPAPVLAPTVQVAPTPAPAPLTTSQS